MRLRSVRAWVGTRGFLDALGSKMAGDTPHHKESEAGGRSRAARLLTPTGLAVRELEEAKLWPFLPLKWDTQAGRQFGAGTRHCLWAAGIRPAHEDGCAKGVGGWGGAADALVDGDSKVNYLSRRWQRWLLVSSLIVASVFPLS